MNAAERPLVQFRPDAFVRLTPDAVLTEDEQGVHVTQPLDLQKNAFRFMLSREAAIDFGLVEPTPEEAAARAAELEAFRARQAAERAQPGPALTLQALLDHLDWPAEFATHLLHPACSCMVTMTEDPYLCSWATELGWSWVWEKSGPVRRRPELCPDCAELTCDADCPTAATNGWPTEVSRG